METETNILRQPYVVNIENTTNDKIKNITIFFSYSSLNEKFNPDGNLEQNGLIISSLKDVSYKKLLEHFYCVLTEIYIPNSNKIFLIRKK